MIIMIIIFLEVRTMSELQKKYSRLKDTLARFVIIKLILVKFSFKFIFFDLMVAFETYDLGFLYFIL